MSESLLVMQADSVFDRHGMTQAPAAAASPWMNHPQAAQMYAAAFAHVASTAPASIVLTTDPTDGTAVLASQRPTYVNAKQYARILKRREARAKLEDYYQQRRVNGPKKPYMHESRHRHALKRPRGPGGRFLTKAELDEYYANHPNEQSDEHDDKRFKTDDSENTNSDS
jgi:CCAAT-binding transcription factor (CBF-B/NF-YA) subunit B